MKLEFRAGAAKSRTPNVTLDFNFANPQQLPAHRRSHDRTETQMTDMRTLSAVIILSAAVATPVFAQGPTHHGRVAHDLRNFRGSYNQANGPSYAAPITSEQRNLENLGFTGRDPSRPGGMDPSLNGGSAN
jgi:hypothetical protein